ncbi:hypothetical protein RSOL_443050 [Rhizoctonia solani AG-3 Rhs1AP]|uniref:Uncharacterized protein n=2 Tax=Rhizoctonia solani AG-3 TaxID=1086053 RepID=A0A074SDP3_9AGAM|nr:hypothetical protein RSOL_443050 [Rhizoctonia solani AG-3 Rhs1AP]KEP55750.1 hypothetical protein V565_000010 [Rhizoctonia solani 123E]
MRRLEIPEPPNPLLGTAPFLAYHSRSQSNHPRPLQKNPFYSNPLAQAPNLSNTLGNLDEKGAARGLQDLAYGATGHLKASWLNSAGTRPVDRARGKREQKQSGAC